MSMAKKVLRSHMRNVLKGISSQEIQTQSQQISTQLQSIISNSKCSTSTARKIGCFLSMDQGEVDTRYILEWLFHPSETNKEVTSRVFLPRCTTTEETGQIKLREDHSTGQPIDHPHLTFHEGDSLEIIKSWKPQGNYQLREPPFEMPPPLPPLMDIMIVPGVAFNLQNGARMGWGAGYYDDFFRRYNLVHNSRPLLIGVALKEQIVTQIDLEPHDQFMDCIVVGDGSIHWINKNKS